ncbi:MAG: hypothetical protein ACOC3V_04270 [bacterium]
MKKIIIIFALLIISVTFLFQYATTEVVTIKVTDKERIVKDNGEKVESYYLVFTEDETFKNVDALFHVKFRSSDLQGKLKVGETYTVKVYGFRSGFLSMYRNIVKIEK